MLNLYTVFHLNLAYSSIEEDRRLEVINRCYWPLLWLSKEYDLPFGIEASGYTLETAAAVDAAWLEELRRLTTEGSCEFIGSGYGQLIGPLVPAEVNAVNLRLGHDVYERLLGFRPQVALVSEQACSAGLIQHYLDAGYQSIIMEWDNPYRFHQEWNPEWRYLPQLAIGQYGEEIPLIWNNAIAFQKFQRYAHGEMELEEYMDYLSSHLTDKPRVFPLYGNDIEIFDFRPGRYQTESGPQEEGEWKRVGRLFEGLLSDDRFQFIRPSQVLESMQVPGGGNRLHLESPEQPIPVKKQCKYNITRWAVTGRDDLDINTACWRIYEALKANSVASDDDWRELCYLWSSDFRTHITEKRWAAYRERLANFEKQVRPSRLHASKKGSNGSRKRPNKLQAGITVERDGRYLRVETDSVRVRLNCQRGLTVDALWFKGISDLPLIGTLHHGYYDDISLGADYYTGHLIFESPGQPKVTDLNSVEPIVDEHKAWVGINGTVSTPLGPVNKRLRIFNAAPCMELEYQLEWESIPLGSLRLGHITLNPAAFENESLFYRTHNGGHLEETFFLNRTSFNQGNAFSFLVSATQGIGLTDGTMEIGDLRHSLRVTVDKSATAGIGLITYRKLNDTYFCRVALSVYEMDETSRSVAETSLLRHPTIRISLTPG